MKRPGIVTALLPEAACLTDNPVINTPIQLTDQVSLYITGMGSDRIEHGVEQLLVAGVDALVTIGTAGALHPGLSPGTCLIPEQVIRHDLATYDFTADWRSRALKNLSDAPMTTHTGNLAHTDSILCSIEEKSALHQKTGAIAVDMESAVVAALANEKNLPVLALRFVVDSASMVIPESVLAQSDPFGNVGLVNLFLSLLKRPGEIPDLIKLGKGFRSASNNLRWLGHHVEKILLSP